ncbi:polysaccharide biosynthesis protein, partial [Fusobacterium varium]|uniref:oligosaccharide flippase family protein n=1 Tax=Fusobacterium varium TaxID=856 RepID=UPI000E524ED3
MNKILQNISELNKKGFFHLITSGIINKIILFCSGIFLVKILSKSEYGIYSYYQNILTFFLFINGFGIASGFFQFGSKNIENKKKISYYKYSIKFSIFSSVVISLMIIIFSFNNKILIKGAQNYLLYISLLPFFYLVIDLITIDQRIKFENKKVAILSNANTFILIIFLLIGAKYGGISGIILGKYIGEIVTIILFFSFYKKIILEWKEIDDISKDEKYEINKFSFFSSINSVIAQLLYVIDIFLIGVLIKDENIIANYKAATLIPFALNFIPQTISNYFYPYFSKNYKNKEYIKDKYKKMFK